MTGMSPSVQQPRKCRKCEEIRQPEEFPIDPRNPTKRTRDCAYCLEAAVGGGQLSLGALAQAGADGANPMAMGAWGPHLGEYWHMDPARSAPRSAVSPPQAAPWGSADVKHGAGPTSCKALRRPRSTPTTRQPVRA